MPENKTPWVMHICMGFMIVSGAAILALRFYEEPGELRDVAPLVGWAFGGSLAIYAGAMGTIGRLKRRIEELKAR